MYYSLFIEHLRFLAVDNDEKQSTIPQKLISLGVNKKLTVVLLVTSAVIIIIVGIQLANPSKIGSYTGENIGRWAIMGLAMVAVSYIVAGAKQAYILFIFKPKGSIMRFC